MWSVAFTATGMVIAARVTSTSAASTTEDYGRMGSPDDWNSGVSLARMAYFIRLSIFVKRHELRSMGGPRSSSNSFLTSNRGGGAEASCFSHRRVRFSSCGRWASNIPPPCLVHLCTLHMNISGKRPASPLPRRLDDIVRPRIYDDKKAKSSSAVPPVDGHSVEHGQEVLSFSASLQRDLTHENINDLILGTTIRLAKEGKRLVKAPRLL